MVGGLVGWWGGEEVGWWGGGLVGRWAGGGWVCTCLGKSEADLLLPLSLSTYVFETGPLTERGDGKDGWEVGCKDPSSLTPPPPVSGFTNAVLSSDFGGWRELVSGTVWFCVRDPNSGPQAGKASHLPPEHLPSPNHSSLLLRKLPEKANY